MGRTKGSRKSPGWVSGGPSRAVKLHFCWMYPSFLGFEDQEHLRSGQTWMSVTSVDPDVSHGDNSLYESYLGPKNMQNHGPKPSKKSPPGHSFTYFWGPCSSSSTGDRPHMPYPKAPNSPKALFSMVFAPKNLKISVMSALGVGDPNTEEFRMQSYEPLEPFGRGAKSSQ